MVGGDYVEEGGHVCEVFDLDTFEWSAMPNNVHSLTQQYSFAVVRPD